MIRQIIFDMDGLMLDSERLMWIKNESETLSEYGYEYDDELFHSMMGLSRQGSIDKLTNHYGNDFPVEEYYRKVEEKNKYMVDNDFVPLKGGVLEFLNFLKTTDIKLTVGTSSHYSYVHTILTNKGIIDNFEHIVCGDEVNRGKPFPDIYLKCMSYYGFSKDEVIVFEDADNGGRAAVAAGARLIMVKDIAPISDEIRNKAERVLNSIDEAIDIIKEEI